ncbi:MAG: hypothetical protein A2016_00785 [Elusimicrobia bacterium GWF2_62_30]|nr:MAG: hypothetical protein A2016_00785 [Elusimicrobia bacterium GWF2_62_30]
MVPYTRTSRQYIAAALCLIAFVYLLTGWALYQSRRQYERQAELSASNLAKSSAISVKGILDKLDVGLFSLSKEAARQNAAGGIDKKTMGTYLLAQKERLADFEELWIADAKGDIHWGTKLPAGKPVNISDRDYFRLLKSAKAARLAISQPVMGRITKAWSVVAAVRINRADGSMAGAVLGSLRAVDYFSAMFSGINVGPGGAIELRDSQLGLIARYPKPGDMDKEVGSRVMADKELETFKANPVAATYTAISARYNGEKLYSYHKVAGYPLFIFISQSSDNLFVPWWQQFVLALALLGLFTLAAGLFIQLVRRRAAEMLRRLDETDNKYRLLVEGTNDIVYSTSSEGSITYLSPQVSRYGWIPEELVGQNLLTAIAEEDRERVAAEHAATVEDGNEIHSQFRALTKDGRTVWFSDNARVRRDESGKITGTAGVLVDITVRKAAEEAVIHSQNLLKETEKIGKVGGWSFNIDTMKQVWTEEVYRIHEVDIKPGPSVKEGINYYAPESRPIIERAVQRAIEHGEGFDLELEIITAKNNRRWVHTIGRADLANRRIYGFFQDITQRKAEKKQLLESEERYRKLVDSVGSEYFFYQHDAAGILTYLSPSVTGMLGYSAEELLAHYSERLTDNPVNKEAQRYTDLSLRGEAQAPYLVEIFHKDGSRRWLEVKETPMRGPDGDVTGVEGLAHDITERKQAEAAIQLSEARLRKITDMTVGVVYEYRLYPDGRSCFPYASVGMNDIYEVTPEEVREDASIVFGRIHPDDLKRVSEAIYESARTLTDFHCELRMVLPRQGLRWRVSHARPERLPDGSTLWYGTITDITERKRVENELKDSVSRFNQLAEQSRTCAWEVDAAGLYTYVSPVFESVTGYSREELVGKRHFYDIHPEDGREAFKKGASEIFARQERITALQNQIKTATGDVLWVSTEGLPVLNAKGELSGYRGSDTDITERKRSGLEKLKLQQELAQSQKMESVGRLAGGVAHDFNNMLTAIGGYAGFLMRGMGEDDPKREDVKEIIVATERAASLTKQLLAFSRKQILNPQVVDLNASVAGVSKLLKRLIGEEIQLQAKFAVQECAAMVDPGQIDQVLVNLAVNARDAMPKGGTLTLETAIVNPDALFSLRHPGLPPGPMVCLTVRDTGCGMTPEAKEHLFEPFFTTKEHGKGTGLGLSTVFGIIKQSGGEIECESEPNSGTVFRIYLPYMGTSVSIKDKDKAKPEDTLLRGSETILLVEDEDILRRLAERLLKMNGYTVIAAADGKSALEAAQRYGKPFDLLVTDVVMPGMNGRELAKEIAARKLAGRTLFMSGYTDDAIVEHGVLEPGIAFIYKPFSVEALSEKLREVLDGPADKAKP